MYSYSRELDVSFDEAVEKTVNTLKANGFGVLTDIDVKKTLKEKINVDFKQYRILGACNPLKAHKALQAEEEIGLLLPCNVIVYEKNDKVVVATLLPSKLFSIIENKSLGETALEVESILKDVINHL